MQNLEHHSARAQEAVDNEEVVRVHNAGFVRLVRFSGGDASIVQAARVSYGTGTKTLREDEKLLAYLIKNHHWSPFEQVNLTFHVKLPIFVARQFVRHRTAKLNEVSARYSELPAEFYIPEEASQREAMVQLVFNGKGKQGVPMPAQDAKNKQGSANTVDVRADLLYKWLSVQEDAFKAYKAMLDAGVARELARACLPVSTYTEWYWQMDLRNLIHFLHLRCDAHAQKEARDYAEAIKRFTEFVAPYTMRAAFPPAEVHA